MRGIVTRSAGVLACVALAAISVLSYLRDLQSRRPVEDFVRRFHVQERRPEYAQTIRYAPASDLAGEVAADVTLQDALGRIFFADVSPDIRRLWIETLGALDDELDSARELLLDAVAKRPGWPYHRSLLGMIEYVRARRHVQLGAAPDRWLRPLELAIPAAPADPSAATFAAAALIEAAPHRGGIDLSRALPIFGAALRDPSFVSEHYLDLVDLAGHEAVWRLLPDAPSPLRAAVQAEASTGDVEAAAVLYPRWERAELRLRESDLRAAELRAERDDVERVRSACVLWAQRHPIFDFDTVAGRRIAAAILALWPNEPGSWLSDPRSDFVRFFLERPDAEVAPAVARAAAVLSDVPPPIAARAALRGGDLYTAQTLARTSETRGSFEWTPFYVELAYAQLRAGHAREANAALDSIAPAAQGECDVALARAAAGGPAPVIASQYRAGAWSQNSLPLCIDRAARTLIARWSVADAPALIDYGFDEGRTATMLLHPGENAIALPLEGRSGRHIFSYRVIAGTNVTPLGAELR